MNGQRTMWKGGDALGEGSEHTEEEIIGEGRRERGARRRRNEFQGGRRGRFGKCGCLARRERRARKGGEYVDSRVLS